MNIPDSPGTTLTLDQILQGIADYVLVRVSQPVYASPAVYPRNSFDTSGQINQYHVKVMFGTGDNPNFNDNPNYSGTLYKFFVFDDTCPHQDDNSSNRCVLDGSITRCCILPRRRQLHQLYSGGGRRRMELDAAGRRTDLGRSFRRSGSGLLWNGDLRYGRPLCCADYRDHLRQRLFPEPEQP